MSGNANAGNEGLPMMASHWLVADSARRADAVWTKAEFEALCYFMLNGNVPNYFMITFRDETTGAAKFVKAKNAKLGARASWAWDSITGKAKSPAGVGFYPTNESKMSRWGAMDFDAHDGNAERARTLALRAFQILRAYSEYRLILTTSGSDGWHLFVFLPTFHPVDEWTLFLKSVAHMLGVQVRSGLCEIFPAETKGACGYGVRAPGTFNPKNSGFGAIAFQNVTDLLPKERKRDCPSLYQGTNREKQAEFPDRRNSSLFRGANEEWKAHFAIIHGKTRHVKLKELVLLIYRQVGHDVARQNATLQHSESCVPMVAGLEDHLTEFEELWSWMRAKWTGELTADEARKFDALTTNNERDLFRIIRGFAKMAEAEGREDFPFARDNLSRRLGITPQGIAKIRERFVQMGVIEMTADFVQHKTSKRYRWLLDFPKEDPF